MNLLIAQAIAESFAATISAVAEDKAIKRVKLPEKERGK